MLPRLRRYHRPAKVQEAISLLQRLDVRTVPLAGGTGLLSTPDPQIEEVVDLQDLPLKDFKKEGGWLHMGALVRLQSVVESPLTQGLLAQGARESAPWLTRNAATVGGCAASADSVDAFLLSLLASEAEVVLAAPERYEQSLDQFLGERQSILDQGALILALLVPQPRGRRGTALLKVSRTPADRPILNAAAAVTLDDEGRCRRAVVVLGGLGARPARLRAVEATLVGTALDEKAMGEAVGVASLPATAPDDARASGAYRLEVAPVLLLRVLRAARDQARRRT